MSFTDAFVFLLGNEGSALLDDPKTGEYSRFGITLKTAEALKLCREGDKSFIDKLTLQDAQQFYYDHFWSPMDLNRIASQPIASKLLDMAVNMGTGEAMKIAQRACNALGSNILTDGRQWPLSVVALNSHDSGQMLLELRAESVQFYRELVETDPAKYEKYWAGWKERAEK